MIIVRFADDYVVGFQYRSDAERFLQDLKARFRRFGLALHPEKTRLVEFGRYAQANRRARKAGKPETFDFLGFTHICGKSRNGHFQLWRKPSGKRRNRTLARIKEALRRRMHGDVLETGSWLGQVLRGWLNYYAVPTSYKPLKRFVERLKREWMKILRRRSQRYRISWERLDAICARTWPKVRIIHPWPEERFAVRTEGRSRMR